jgi:phage terminase large subunit-like protein
MANIATTYHKRFLHYKPSDKQKAFHDLGEHAIERLFLAGNRTGKTFCGCLEDAIHLTGRYPSWWKGHRFNHPIICWVASENYEITRNVLQSKLLGGYSKDGGFTEGLIHKDLILNKGSIQGVSGAIDYVKIKHISGGTSTLYFKSYQQGREKFQGARCHLIHLDEEPPHSIFLECQIRLSDVDGVGQGRLLLTMTPLKGYTEMTAYFLERMVVVNKDEVEDKGASQKKEIFRNKPETVSNGKAYVQATWDDNPHLADDTKERLRAALKPHELEAREKGVPCIGTGLVYQVPEKEFLIDPINIPYHWAKVFGMDVGFFAPTAVVFLAHDRDNDVLYIYAEYSDNELTAAQHAAKLLPIGCNWQFGICDPAVNHGSQRDGERLLDDYKKVGMKLKLAKYAKELAVDKVLERIRTGQFKVVNTCTKFMTEWRAYSRDDNGKIIKGNDHLMNALEFVMTDGLTWAITKEQHNNPYGHSRNRPALF